MSNDEHRQPSYTSHPHQNDARCVEEQLQTIEFPKPLELPPSTPLELFLGMQPVTLVIAADNQLSV